MKKTWSVVAVMTGLLPTLGAVACGTSKTPEEAGALPTLTPRDPLDLSKSSHDQGGGIVSVDASDVVKDASTYLKDATTVKDAGIKDGGVAKDAGAPLDAGGAKDAGASKDAGVVKDAGAPKAAPMTAERKAVNGKCEAGWIVFPTNSETCRKVCATDADCGGLSCAQKGSQKLCR